MKKHKILLLSDHPLSTSGVGVQARYLINGLVATGRYSFRCFGAALKHTNYDVVKVSDDFVVKPIDGFGTKELLRMALVTERPDVLMLFTDPRFFIWVWEMEDEIHQICPISYWHVWDNVPVPVFNDPLYLSTDLINCHSYLTYTMLKDRFPDRVNFIPHAVPTDVFYPLDSAKRVSERVRILGASRRDHFVCIWVNRNARRKKPSDILNAFRLFIDGLRADGIAPDVTLLMHTDPLDNEGPNLYAVVEHFGIVDNVVFSIARLGFDEMRSLYNISDVCINAASAEGFGLSTLEAMQCGLPIIAVKTGGLTRQVVDHRDGSENGIALDPDVRTMVGSQLVPYIYEDHVSNEKIAAAIRRMYDIDAADRRALGEKARAYALSEFDMRHTVSGWDRTTQALIDGWRQKHVRLRDVTM